MAERATPNTFARESFETRFSAGAITSTGWPATSNIIDFAIVPCAFETASLASETERTAL